MLHTGELRRRVPDDGHRKGAEIPHAQDYDRGIGRPGGKDGVIRAAKKLQLEPSLEIERIGVLLAICLSALRCAERTGPGGPENSRAIALSREGHERELP